MNKKKKQVILLISLILVLIMINYSFIDNALENFFLDYEIANVERVIDGDTIVIDNGTSVRLLGINCPEKGERYYEEAKGLLEELVLNKTVKIKFGKERYDIYNRILAYIFVGETNVNLELINKGFANFYFPSGKDTYYNDFKQAWENCIKEDINLCEKSENRCADCIKLSNFDFKNQEIAFANGCDFDCDLTGWKIKDEGRKNFVFGDFILKDNEQVKIIVGESVDMGSTLFWKNEDYVWTDSGDTLFLRDDADGLVLWEIQGY
ncbi:MAG TPA: thermonuclease family protein [Candidatus Paceibacterota bacterium]|nr:thermonuclease family protein [Candidatus Paceibacterota bacterium]